MEFRPANAADVALIAAHRRTMFDEDDIATADALVEIERNSAPWTERMIRDNRYAGWIATDEGQPVGSAGLLILDWPPHPLDPSGEQRGYLLNVFVEPSHRRRGLARQLVQLCMDEAHRRGIRVIALHASKAGRPVYEGLDFHPTSEMMHTTSATN
jgi:GNAT superfamily N-acetyltransferase